MQLAYVELARRREGVTYLNLAAPPPQGKKKQNSSARAQSFDEAKHPRHASGAPEGGEFVKAGAARDERGKKAQGNKKAQANFEGAQTGKAKVDKNMSDKDLQDLSEYAYSFKSKDPKVVALRTSVANELARRGQNVNDHGGQGGKSPASGSKKSAKPSAKKTKPKAKASAASSADARIKSKIASATAAVHKAIYSTKKKK